MTKEEFAVKNTALRHAIQSGVAHEYEIHGAEALKHLRVGINSNACEISSICKLLVDKGLVTWDEIYEHSIEELKREVERYEERLSEYYGGIVKLG